MASGRFLSVSIAEDNKLGNLSITAELVYLKTIPHLDRDGMINGKPGFLWGKVCPLREELFGQTAAIIDEWVAVGLVIRFNTEEGPALFFKGFAKNNNLPHYNRERPSRFPPPPGYVRTDTGLIPEGFEPPKKPVRKPKPAPVLPPSNGNCASVQDELQEYILDELLELDLQEQDKEEDKAASAAPALPAADDDESDDVMGLVRLAYNTIGRISPSFVGEGGRGNLIVASELIERYGLPACIRGISTLKERNSAMVKKNSRNGIRAPIGYLRTILEDEQEASTAAPTAVLDFALEDTQP